MIQAQRLRQQQQQLKAIAPKQFTAIASYQGRDPVTGDRLLQSADGGIARTNWIASSQPQDVPPLVVLRGAIGQPGYASQRST